MGSKQGPACLHSLLGLQLKTLGPRIEHPGALGRMRRRWMVASRSGAVLGAQKLAQLAGCAARNPGT